MTVAEALQALRTRGASSLELVDDVLARAECRADLGAFVLLDADGARRQARAADARRAAGEDAPLLGVPVVVKDVVDVAGLPTCGASARWKRVPAADADCVAALRGAGAVVVGKTHTNEFAYGIDGRNPHYPPCRNPHDPERLPGGSSSGSTVAVAAGIAPAGLGTDTSGSLRVPAALCGVVGLRTTTGRVPRRGVLPLAPTYDVVGPVTATVADARLLLALLARDAREDACALPQSAGLVESLLAPGVTHPAVAAVVRAAAGVLEELGVAVSRVDIPGLEDAVAVHRSVQLPEAARSAAEIGFDPADVAPDVRARIADGLALQARYGEALARRRQLAEDILAALDRHDVLLAPAAPCVAPGRDAVDVDLGGGAPCPLRDALLACAVPFSQHGGPALCLPCGAVSGLPVGLQVVGRPGGDEALLALGARLEAALPPLRATAET